MELYFFNDFVHRIEPLIETDDVEMEIRSSGSAVCTEVRLEMTIRYLAGDAVWDIRSNFGVSPCKLYRSVWRVIDTLNNDFPVDLDISDLSRLKQLESGFSRKSRQKFIRGAIGSIEGCLIWQKNRGVDVDNPNS